MSMNYGSMLLIWVGLVCTASANLDVSISTEIRLGKLPPPPPPEVVIVEPVGPKGPPPWAPAHGFRRNHEYYYYPAAEVYYRPADHMWFYLEGSDWRFGVNLPARVNIDFERSTRLVMETDEPFHYHGQVRTYYPVDYFLTRVRLKNEPASKAVSEASEGKAGKPDRKKVPPDSVDHGRPDTGPGPSSGKGQGKGRNK